MRLCDIMDSGIIRCEGCNDFLVTMENVTIVCCDDCKIAYYYHEKCVSNEETYCHICDSELVYYNSSIGSGGDDSGSGGSEQVTTQENQASNGPVAESIPQVVDAEAIPPLAEPETIPNVVADTDSNLCNICGDAESSESNPLITTSCNHIYHYDCLLDWFKNYNSRECPYCRAKYAPIAVSNGKNYYHRFNVVDKSLFKDICISEDGCVNRGYPALGNLCFYDYEKKLVNEYMRKREEYLYERTLANDTSYRTCCGILKNACNCTFQAKYICNYKPYCGKHFTQLMKNTADGIAFLHNKENSFAIVSSTDRCTHINKHGNQSCTNKVTIVSGYDKLCKEHYHEKIFKEFDDVHLNDFDGQYDLLYSIKFKVSKEYCAGYRKNNKKCFIEVENGLKYCCTRHSLTYFKPRWFLKQCRGCHPITKQGCGHPVYDEHMLCIKHTVKLDRESTIEE